MKRCNDRVGTITQLRNYVINVRVYRPGVSVLH